MTKSEAVRRALQTLKDRETPEQKEEAAKMSAEGTAVAPEGQTWVCQACGKTSRSRYGFDAANKSVAMRGWDEICMMNASLFEDSQLLRNLSGIVVEVRSLVHALPLPSPFVTPEKP